MSEGEEEGGVIVLAISRYENARQQIDAIFGQKFHPTFPRLLRPCDQSGCGQYPSTSGGTFNAGIDVQVSTPNIPLPLSGYVRLFNASILPSSGQYSYAGSENYSTNSVILTPAESSHVGVYLILSNLVPVSDIGMEDQFFAAGDTIAAPRADSASFVHVEVIKEVDGVGYRLDPTSYLQPRLEPNVSLALECNDVVIRTGGVVVERLNFVDPLELVTRELLGDPLVIGTDSHTPILATSIATPLC